MTLEAMMPAAALTVRSCGVSPSMSVMNPRMIGRDLLRLKSFYSPAFLSVICASALKYPLLAKPIASYPGKYLKYSLDMCEMWDGVILD